MLMRRIQVTILVTVLVLTIMSGVPASSSDEGSPERKIGVYERWMDSGDLSEKHVTRDGKNLAIQGPSFTNTLRVDKNFLEVELGAWSASAAFTLDGDHAVFNGRSADFAPLELGAEPAFTLGGRDQIEFQERPMWVSVEQDEPGGQITLHMEDGDTSGQPIFIAKEWLWGRGIHRPLAVHEDGTNLSVEGMPGRDGWVIDVHHFSYVLILPIDEIVFSRQDGIIVPHTGETRWYEDEKRLEIDVGGNLDCASHVLAGCGSIDQDVMVDKDWLDMNINHLSLQEHVWEVNSYNLRGFEKEKYYEVRLTSSQTPTTVVYDYFIPTSTTAYTRGNPETVQIWSWNESTLYNLPPMAVKLPDGDNFAIDIDREGLYRLQFNKSWLDNSGIYHPHFEFNGQDILYFKSHDSRFWIMELTGGGEIVATPYSDVPYLKESRNRPATLWFEPSEQKVKTLQNSYVGWVEGALKIKLLNMTWFTDHWGGGNVTSVDLTYDGNVLDSIYPVQGASGPYNDILIFTLSQDDVMKILGQPLGMVFHQEVGGSPLLPVADILITAPDLLFDFLIGTGTLEDCPAYHTWLDIGSYEKAHNQKSSGPFIPQNEAIGSWGWTRDFDYGPCPDGHYTYTQSGNIPQEQGFAVKGETHWLNNQFQTQANTFHIYSEDDTVFYDEFGGGLIGGFVHLSEPRIHLKTPIDSVNSPLATFSHAHESRMFDDGWICNSPPWQDHILYHVAELLLSTLGWQGTVASLLLNMIDPTETYCVGAVDRYEVNQEGETGGGVKKIFLQSPGYWHEGSAFTQWDTVNPAYSGPFNAVYEEAVSVHWWFRGCLSEPYLDPPCIPREYTFTNYWRGGFWNSAAMWYGDNHE